MDRIQERIAEQTTDILVPQDVEEPPEFFKASFLDRVQQSSAEQTVETPDITLGEKIVKKTVEVPEVPPLQFTDKVVDIPVVAPRQISQLQVQVVAETVEIPRLRIVEKMNETPEFNTGTCENPFAKMKGLITELISQLQREVLDACLTCDTRCKVACDTCMKDNMFKVASEITVVGKLLHETAMRDITQNIGIDSFIDDSNRVDSKGLQYQDCEVLFHFNKQSPDTTKLTVR